MSITKENIKSFSFHLGTGPLSEKQLKVIREIERIFEYKFHQAHISRGGYIGVSKQKNPCVSHHTDFFERIVTCEIAYEYLFRNILIQNPVLTKVEQLRELKFDHCVIVDKEYSYKHGQDNFFMEKYLDKKTKLVWLHESPSVISIHIDGKKFKELEFEEVIEIVKDKFNK
tara:strand:+ start:1309 stop:1821 length:513 start_codon:yes stop_codon:yes gene_type:complete